MNKDDLFFNNPQYLIIHETKLSLNTCENIQFMPAMLI